MLKGINPLLSPTLLHVLAAMGHGDEIAVVDRNYPAHSSGAPVVHLDGVGTAEALAAVLELMPLDTFVDHPLLHMRGADADVRQPLAVHEDALAVAVAAERRSLTMAPLDREDFYQRARQCQAIVITGETRPYGCFLLVKGVLPAM